jgi:hypothetical protein
LITGSSLQLRKQQEEAAKTLGRIAALDQIDKLLSSNPDLGALALQAIDLDQKNFDRLTNLLSKETLSLPAKAHVINSLAKLVKHGGINPKVVADLLTRRLDKEATIPTKRQIVESLGERVPPDFGGKLNVSPPTPRTSWQKVGVGRVTAYPSIRCNDATFCQFAHRATAIHPWPKSGGIPSCAKTLSAAKIGPLLYLGAQSVIASPVR